MLRQERSPDLEETIRQGLDALRSDLWTAMPGYIVSFDPVAETAVVQPTIQGRHQALDGTITLIDMPLIPDVPVQAIHGGGATLTFPIAENDECLLVFASRCIDAWWQSGGIQAPMEARTHDLSDAFAIVGWKSQPKKLPEGAPWDTTTVQLRADDGQTLISLDPTGQVVAVVAPMGINLNGVLIDADGNLGAPGEITRGVGGTDEVTLGKHKHGGVEPGGGETDVPVAGT